MGGSTEFSELTFFCDIIMLFDNVVVIYLYIFLYVCVSYSNCLEAVSLAMKMYFLYLDH